MADTTARGAGPAERAHHAGGDGPAPERRRRMSARRKQGAVLRLLLELGRNFIAIPIRKHQDAICSLARALAEPDAGH